MVRKSIRSTCHRIGSATIRRFDWTIRRKKCGGLLAKFDLLCTSLYLFWLFLMSCSFAASMPHVQSAAAGF